MEPHKETDTMAFCINAILFADRVNTHFRLSLEKGQPSHGWPFSIQ